MAFPTPGNWFFVWPWISFIPWWGMLIAMLIIWSAEGHPIYWFMSDDQFPVYISDIGATNLKPLFIACAAWQGAGYVIMVALEYFQRSGHWPFRMPSKEYPENSSEENSSEKSGYSSALAQGKFLMPPFFTKHESNLVWASFFLAIIGEAGLILCSIFSTSTHPNVHIAMVTVFVVFIGLSVICHIAQYMTMGRHYAMVHPLTDEGSRGKETSWNKWRGHVWNKYTISGSIKIFWLVAAFTWAICFAAVESNSISSCFEWLLAFWFGIYFIIVSVDWYLGGRYRKSKYFLQIQVSQNLNFPKYHELQFS